MSRTTLKVGLVDGPSYQPLYRSFAEFSERTGIEIQIVFQGTHPDLNRFVQKTFESGENAFDLLSTHTKYVPSQARYLLPLNEAFSTEELGDFSPALLELARYNSTLMSIPRNFDARLLFYRADRLAELAIEVPRTWRELSEAAQQLQAAGYTGFVYPGKESGLFGTFFELLIGEGGRLFDEHLQPAFYSRSGMEALRWLKELYRKKLTPEDLPDYHYDEVSASFRSGDSTMTTDWPGYWGLLNDNACVVHDKFGVALTPASERGKRAVYCGSHSFAVTAASERRDEAIELLKFITSPQIQAIDAANGHVPVRISVMDRIKQAAKDHPLESRRWALLEETMDTSVIIPPKFAEYPETEDILWQSLRRCIIGSLTEEQALSEAASAISKIVSKYRP